MVDEVMDEIDLDDLRTRVAKIRESNTASGHTVLHWKGACVKVAEYFEQKIKPHTDLGDLDFNTYSLVYYHMKDKALGFQDTTDSEQFTFVTICLRYNSRFPLWVERVKTNTIGPPPLPVYGSAAETVLEPGQIMISSGGQFIWYPSGKTEGVKEGDDGGLSIFLRYKKVDVD
ncbi:hypothetical protein GP486_001917 [Trichoglossum hirsutum]|uniref:Uncharacterized protein n=1 Tax=Trichoglossum hirsutum TaxID=265104 RepID=A0A9P8RS67_9PEZI|nr:hypothetical protein GP486_001917 [Trichoglossum hirsutum]